ncbi:MAG: hypothetical protein M1840_002421 [Geoglossum simile]|nr:MAG: hypothetical protein M1840_002421 [Geoglossum simile]
MRHDSDEAHVNKFYVARYLREFLEHIRDEKNMLKYWIGAVCINQEDVDERNRHVKFMKDIYEKAKAVTVWLGTKADNSGLALKTIQAMHLIADVRAKARLWQAMPFFLQSFPFMTPYPQLLGIGEDQTKLLCSALLVATLNIGFAKMAAEALRKLFDRPWWQRVWIVQEVTVPHKDIFVMCGKDSVTWESCQEASDLYGSFHCYALSDLTLAVPFYNIDRLLRIQRARRDPPGPT